MDQVQLIVIREDFIEDLLAVKKDIKEEDMSRIIPENKEAEVLLKMAKEAQREAFHPEKKMETNGQALKRSKVVHIKMEAI